MGLSQAKKIAERHGGTLWLESVVDSGTTVWFSLGDPL
jgi:signal transduction histidine kinase